MPCLHCRGSMLGVIEARLRGEVAKEDPWLPMTQTMGASGPRFAPEGFEDGRVCRLCGVLYFEPKSTRAPDVAASRDTLDPTGLDMILEGIEFGPLPPGFIAERFVPAPGFTLDDEDDETDEEGKD